LLVEGGDGYKPAEIGLLRQLVNVECVDHPHPAEANYTDAKGLNRSLG